MQCVLSREVYRYDWVEKTPLPLVFVKGQSLRGRNVVTLCKFCLNVKKTGYRSSSVLDVSKNNQNVDSDGCLSLPCAIKTDVFVSEVRSLWNNGTGLFLRCLKR